MRDLGPGEYRCHLENNLIHWVFGTKGAFKALRAEHGERLRMAGGFHATATPAGHLMHRDGGKHLADPISCNSPPVEINNAGGQDRGHLIPHLHFPVYAADSLVMVQRLT